MRAIILAGGFGTRLQTVISDLPKPMAPIQGEPFLAYLLSYLRQQGIKEVILSVHYLRQKIIDYFQEEYAGIKISYAIEEQPLGTGGAICYALQQVVGDEPVFVLNGDTFVPLDYDAMYAQHLASEAHLSMALREISDCSRYGHVTVEQGQITSFQEKGMSGPGYINAGVYLLQKKLFKDYQFSQAFSFEKDFLLEQGSQLKIPAFFAQDYFIDIGIPEDYARANQELPYSAYIRDKPSSRDTFGCQPSANSLAESKHFLGAPSGLDKSN